MPPHMAFSREFIRELRVHIPWISLGRKPIEITLTRLSDSDHRSPSTRFRRGSGSGRAADLIAKVVANITLKIQGLSFTFIEEINREELAVTQTHNYSTSLPSIPCPLPHSPRANPPLDVNRASEHKIRIIPVR